MATNHSLEQSSFLSPDDVDVLSPTTAAGTSTSQRLQRRYSQGPALRCCAVRTTRARAGVRDSRWPTRVQSERAGGRGPGARTVTAAGATRVPGRGRLRRGPAACGPPLRQQRGPRVPSATRGLWSSRCAPAPGALRLCLGAMCRLLVLAGIIDCSQQWGYSARSVYLIPLSRLSESCP